MMESVGSRALSSFTPEDVHFDDYNANQIQAILRRRQDAFDDGVVDEDVIPLERPSQRKRMVTHGKRSISCASSASLLNVKATTVFKRNTSGKPRKRSKRTVSSRSFEVSVLRKNCVSMRRQWLLRKPIMEPLEVRPAIESISSSLSHLMPISIAKKRM